MRRALEVLALLTGAVVVGVVWLLLTSPIVGAATIHQPPGRTIFCKLGYHRAWDRDHDRIVCKRGSVWR